jgi:hypothetical protein
MFLFGTYANRAKPTRKISAGRPQRLVETSLSPTAFRGGKEGSFKMPNEATNELSDEVLAYLRIVISEDEDRNRDHLKWLEKNTEEEDRELQRAECERTIELAGKALAALTPAA